MELFIGYAILSLIAGYIGVWIERKSEFFILFVIGWPLIIAIYPFFSLADWVANKSFDYQQRNRL